MNDTPLNYERGKIVQAAQNYLTMHWSGGDVETINRLQRAAAEEFLRLCRNNTQHFGFLAVPLQDEHFNIIETIATLIIFSADGYIPELKPT